MKFLETFEKHQKAITFANIAEYNTALDFMNKKAKKKQSKKEKK